MHYYLAFKLCSHIPCSGLEERSVHARPNVIVEESSTQNWIVWSDLNKTDVIEPLVVWITDISDGFIWEFVFHLFIVEIFLKAARS
jgi:hypothetical protein